MKKKESKKISKIKQQYSNIKIKEYSQTFSKCYSNNNTNTNISNKNKITQKKILSIISNNLKTYSITKKNYNIYIINSIIFDQKNHIVTEFKNYLLWDETSEFLKRYYKSVESIDRLPNISQYYETYTLFSPIYFGFEGPLVIIMNGWTRRKRNYLEYIEDKEEEEEQKKNDNKNLNFKKLLETKLISSDTSDINTKKTIELTKYDNIDSFFIKDNNNISSLNENINEKKEIEKNIYDKKDISLSKIMDDLSSNYSIYIVNTYNIKKNKEKKLKNNSKKRKIEKDSKKEINKRDKEKEKDKDKNIILSDKVLFSFTNLYKNRNKKYNNKNKSKKYHYGTSNNSTSKVKRSYNERNKEKKMKDNNKTKYKINNITNIPLIDIKNNNNNNNIKDKFSRYKNNLQITVNNFVRNKTSIKEKKEKDNIKKHALTNNNNTNTNINSYNNSTNNSLSKLKIRKQKLKKLYLRNLKIMTQPSFPPQKDKDKSPISNTIDANTNPNDNIYNIKKNNKYNFTRLLTCRDGKFKKYVLNGNLTNLNNFNTFRYIKPNKTQINYDPFTYKINKLIKEKKISSTNSFTNKNKNNTNNSKKDKKNIKNKINNFILLNKRLSNGNLIRNLVLSQFHSKKEIVHKPNNIVHHKMTSSLIKNNINTNNNNRNSSLLKNKKRNYTGISNKRLNESLNIKPYKKEMNKINLNFNFNINFNIDFNKKRKYMIAHKNNIGFFTQRNPIIKRNKINKSKSKGNDSSHKKNVFNSLIKAMKYENNLRTKK